MFRPHIAAFLLAMLVSAGARGQTSQAPAHVGYAFPAGGKQDSTFQVVLGGQNIETATEAVFSGQGIKATVVDHFKPVSPGQFQILREQFKTLSAKKDAALNSTSATRPTWSAADEARLVELKKRLSKPPRRIENPALAETVTLEVTIDPSAAHGDREVRLRTFNGLSNPVRFRVGKLQEYTAGAIRQKAIELPAVVNGQILPGGADRFAIKARKGQRIVIVTAARALMPYLSDAVPGWFQAAVTVCDSKGREIAFADHFRFDPDPVLCIEIPEDGEYSIEIRDSIYRGREDFVYRVSVGELPFITGIFPLGCKAGDRATIALTGWNLPAKSLVFDAAGKKPGVYRITLEGGGLDSNSVPFAVDSIPDVREPSSATPLALPVVVSGRIDQPGKTETYRFEGKAGDEVVAQVVARSLNSPLDSLLTLTDPSGKMLATSDDHEDKAAALITHHADSYIAMKLPATGTYTLRIADAQGKSGAEFAYRLRIAAPEPDFALRVTPASVGVRAGGSAQIMVFALRREGFTGDITVELKDPPRGFSLSGAKIPADKEQAAITLKVPMFAIDHPIALEFQGRATVAGKTVVHEAIPAQDMMQAFYYHHLVPAGEFLVAVTPRAFRRPAATLPGKGPAKP
jgi:hypothetical protein